MKQEEKNEKRIKKNVLITLFKNTSAKLKYLLRMKIETFTTKIFFWIFSILSMLNKYFSKNDYYSKFSNSCMLIKEIICKLQMLLSSC